MIDRGDELEKLRAKVAHLQEVNALLRLTVDNQADTLARVQALLDDWVGGTGHTDNNRFVSLADLKFALRGKAPDDLSHRPHSRACGILKHDHGSGCSANCPTCGGK